MKKIGWTDDYIKTKVLNEPIKDRPKLSIKLIEDPGNLKVPTWDEIDEEVKILKKNNKFKNSLKDLGLDISKADDVKKVDEYMMILKKTPFDKIKDLETEVKKFRQLLEDYLGNNELFSNKGFTITPDGHFGLREWILSKPDFGWELSDFEKAGFKVEDIELKWE